MNSITPNNESNSANISYVAIPFRKVDPRIHLQPVKRIDNGANKTRLVLQARNSTIAYYSNLSTSSLKKPIMAIVASTRSISDWKTVWDTPFQIHLLPSIQTTVTASEITAWDIRLYMAMDDNDMFWTNASRWLDLYIPSFLTLHVHIFPSTLNRIPFNEIALAAYQDGAEYFCRINDDSVFTSTSWIGQAVYHIQHIYNPPNIGVVGLLCGNGATNILTHDFVHRTHMDIFGGYYYPVVFKNYFLDDWITNVYSKKVLGRRFHRSTRMDNWTMAHWMVTERYKRAKARDRGLLPAQYDDGYTKIRNYMKQQHLRSIRLLKQPN